MRTRILVPSGIGDGYWVIAKLRGFIEKLNLAEPEIWVDPGPPQRAHDMWKRVPFVRWGGYAEFAPNRPTKVTLNRAYRLPKFAIQRRALGYDFFVSLNGALISGLSLDQAIPGPTNWFEPFTNMEITESKAAEYQFEYGSYVVVGLWDQGFYRRWLECFPETSIVEMLRIVADAGYTVVLMGAPWDKGRIPERIASHDERFESLVGETSFDDLTGLLAGASAVFGFPAGSTLIGPRFGAPTLMLWTSHFRTEMWRNSCPPDPKLYLPMDARGALPGAVAETLLRMAKPVQPATPAATLLEAIREAS